MDEDEVILQQAQRVVAVAAAMEAQGCVLYRPLVPGDFDLLAQDREGRMYSILVAAPDSSEWAIPPGERWYLPCTTLATVTAAGPEFLGRIHLNGRPLLYARMCEEFIPDLHEVV